MASPRSPQKRSRRAHDLAALIALQERIAQRDPATRTLDLILEAASKLARAQGAMFEKSDSGSWTCVAASGCCAPRLAIRAKGGPAFGVPMDEMPVTVCNDTLVSGAADREACKTIGARSILAVPLKHEDSLSFALTMVSGEAGTFATMDDDVLQLLAGMAMTAHLESERAPHREDDLAGEIVSLTAAVQREHRFVKLLQEIAVAANESASVEEAIRRSLEHICDAAGWPAGHLYLTSEGGDRLLSTPVWHVSHAGRFNALRRLTDALEWRKSVGLPGRVLASKKPEWVTDIRKDPSIVRTSLATSLGVRSSFALPLLIGAEVAAVLEFFSVKVLEPDERLLEVAGHIGVQLGRVIERKRASLVLAASERHYRLLFERNLAGVFRMAQDGTLLDCNDSFVRILGYDSRQELRTKSMFDLMPESNERAAQLESLARDRTLTNAEMLMEQKDGGRIWTLVSASLFSMGEHVVIEGTLLDITARKLQEQNTEFAANHDALTGLNNRSFFRSHLEKSLALAQRYDHPLALLFLDLDGFKPINDTLGHAAGDWILQETASRLVQSVRGSDLVARLGGDEFVVLLTTLSNAADAETVAQKLLSRIGTPFTYDVHELKVSASIGVGLYPDDAADAETLIEAADQAMYGAKKAGGHGYRFRSS